MQAMGIQFEDIKVPPHIWEKTQGFRIYYAKRRHEDKRILGQSLINPYAPTWEKAYPGCASESTLGESFDSALQGYLRQGRNTDRLWVNWPYTLPSYAYPSIRYHDTKYPEYQAFSLMDFHLLRAHRSVNAATHIKVESIVEQLPVTGPGLIHNCWYHNTSPTCPDSTVSPPDPYLDYDGQLGNWVSAFNTAGECIPQPAGTTDCTVLCVEDNIMNGMFVGFNYYSPTQTPFSNGGGTNGLTTYQWLGGGNTDAYPRFTDLNRVLKERCKTYVRGDSIFNARQLGYGYKIFNDYGESHLSFLLHEDSTLRAFSPEQIPGDDTTVSTWITNATEPDMDFQAFDMDQIGEPKPVNYLCNLHAFRQDMYNSLDTQDLVWTGYEVTGADYKHFWVDDEGAPVTDIADDRGHGHDTANNDVITRFKTAHVFGGDTFICRYAYRKTLRSNIAPASALKGVLGAMTDFDPGEPSWGGGYDMRYMYDFICESTDNINFRHMMDKTTSYYPAAPARDVLALDNTVDLSAQGKMKYNADYSNVNDIGHTVPLPLQIIEPDNFPTRVVRSTKSDDTSLIDSYRIFKALQFKDLPKNRGELWKLSTFNNILYLHMQDSLFKTLGKQKMQMTDTSEAFIGGGDIFERDPEEMIQTQDGFGGMQSQWSTCITSSGYFYLNQRARRIYLTTDKIQDITTGLEKWFNINIAYNLEQYEKRNFDDNTLTFGFHSVWDEEYQRILLTKREITPTKNFSDAYNAYSNSTTSDVGVIQYVAENDTYLWNSGAGGSAASNWETMVIDPTYQVDSPSYRDLEWFRYDGWTISYYPRLNVWVSFHDYIPYRYMTTSKELYSLRRFSTKVNEDPALYDTTAPDNFLDNENWINRIVWKHNSLINKGDFYGGVIDHEFGVVEVRAKQSEIEVIHNEGRDVSKLFHNFSFINDVMNQDFDTEDLATWKDNRLNNMQGDPGYDYFILWNKHQCSSLTAIEPLINARNNGGEWYINKFRSHIDPTTNTAIVGGENSGNYYDLYYPNAAPTNVINGTDSQTIDDRIWVVDGMHENLNGTLVGSFISNNPKKFVDKFLAIRLIISNLDNNLVNLYSTKVGVRKFYRNG